MHFSFYSAGNYREALPLLEKLGPRLPENTADAPYLISICYVMTQQWDSARKVLAQMFYVPPGSAMAYLMLGKLMVRQQIVQARRSPDRNCAATGAPPNHGAFLARRNRPLPVKPPKGPSSEFQKELAVNPTVWLVYWRLGGRLHAVGKVR